MYKSIGITLFIVALFGWGCATTGPEKSRYDVEVSPEMAQEFQQAEALFRGKQYAQALGPFEQYTSRYPYNRSTDRAWLRQGQIHLHLGQPAAAVDPLKRAAKGIFDPEVTPEVLYDLMIAYDRMGQPADAWQVLKTVRWPATRAKQRLLLASLGIKVGQLTDQSAQALAPLYLEVIDAYVILQKAPKPAPTWLLARSSAEDWVHRWIEGSGGDVRDLERMAKRFSGKTSGGYVLYKLGKTAYEAGKEDVARDAYERYVRGYPKQAYVGTARIRLAELGRKIDSDYVAIGVVLPFSGRYGGYGKAVLRGIECGAGIMRPCKSHLPIRLIIRDSAGDPVHAKAAFEELLATDFVMGVIGPLAQIEVDAVARQADLHQVPTIALSQKAGIASLSPYMFRNFLTVEDQVRTLVDHLCLTDIREVAILYPNSGVGRQHREIFEAAFAECDGTIKVAEAYNPRTGNFQDAIRALKFGVSKHELGETLGFNALFIPDSYKNLSQIIPLLSFLNVQDVQLLGTAGWNNPKLVSEFPEVMEGSVFVGGFFSGSQALPANRFTKIYRDAYGSDPSFLEAYGYDSLEMLKSAIRDSSAESREEVRDALARIQRFPGATGAINMDSDGDAQHRLSVLTVQEGQIVETP